MNNTQAYICKSCWVNLGSFHEFYTAVAANYDSDSRGCLTEEKYQIPNTSDLIVYDEENSREDEDMIKVEVVNDIEGYTETEWLEEEKEALKEESQQKVVQKIRNLAMPRLARGPPVVLDSADDQRIRETANMFCDVCREPLDSLRDAKSHFKQTHATEGYIICCDRKFKQRCRLVEHVNTHFNFSYTCPICCKTFDSKSYLTKHLALHDSNKQYVRN